jgi:hypothetical protein
MFNAIALPDMIIDAPLSLRSLDTEEESSL